MEKKQNKKKIVKKKTMQFSPLTKKALRYDILSPVPSSLTTRTTSGGLITLLTFILCAVLAWEGMRREGGRIDTVWVGGEKGGEVKFRIEIKGMPCWMIGVGVDVSDFFSFQSFSF